MNLHNKIMNINVNPESRERVINNPDLEACDVYNLGHRDMRHQAAEASLKHQAYIEKLEELLDTCGHEINCPVDLEQLKKEFGL